MDAHDEEIVKGSGLPPDPYAIEIASDILGNLSANQAEEDLLEATSHFTNVLKQKGVSTATLMVRHADKLNNSTHFFHPPLFHPLAFFVSFPTTHAT